MTNQLKDKEMTFFCSNCGTKQDADAMFCVECGTAVASTNSGAPTANTSTIHTQEAADAKARSAQERAEKAKYAVDAAADVAGSAVSAATTAAVAGAAIMGELGSRAKKGIDAADPMIKKKIVGIAVLVTIGAAGYFGFKAITGGSGPENVIRSFYTSIEKGDTEAFLKYTTAFGEEDELKLGKMEKAKLDMVMTQATSEMRRNEGIDHIKIKCTEDDDKPNQQYCKATVTYGNGDDKIESFRMKKIDGQWKIKNDVR